MGSIVSSAGVAGTWAEALEALGLGKYANKSAVAGQGLSHAPLSRPEWSRGSGVGLWDLKRWLWRNSTLKGLSKCDRVRWSPFVQVWLTSEGVAFLGVSRCSSVWACPSCAQRIRRSRSRELGAGLRQWVSDGHGVVFATLTVPHSAVMPLKPLFAAVTSAWNSVVTDFGVRALRKRLPFRYVRSLEVTSGDNGWHPHLHNALLFDRPLSRDEVLELDAECFRAWSSAVVRLGLAPPSRSYGVRMVRVGKLDGAENVGRYVAKIEGLSAELVRLDSKESRKGHAPFQLLREVAGGNSDLVPKWYEYENASRGRRALSWSQGCREALALGVEASDEELSDPAASSSSVLLGQLSSREHDWLIAHPRGPEHFCEALGPASGPEDVRAAVAWLWDSLPASALAESHPDRPYLEGREREREAQLMADAESLVRGFQAGFFDEEF